MLLSCLMEPFCDWLTREIENLNMTPADLARAIKKDNGVISRILNNPLRVPEPETLQLIATAIKKPIETVYRAAGLLPQVTKDDEVLEQLRYFFTELPDQERMMLVEYAQFLLSKVEHDRAKK